MGNVLTWVIILAVVFIGVQMFMSVSSVTTDTPVYNTSNSAIVNATAQQNTFSNLLVQLAPVALLALAGLIVLKALGAV